MRFLFQIRGFVARLYRQLTRPLKRMLLKFHEGSVHSVDRDSIVRLIGRSGLFSERWYAWTAKSTASRRELIRHYVAVGEAAGFRPNELFDPAWYRKTYSDVGPTSPLVHYILIGNRQGRRPGPEFDPQDYLARYPDITAAGVDPLRHYLETGRLEGRTAYQGQAPVEPGAWFGAATLRPNDLDAAGSRCGAEESAQQILSFLEERGVVPAAVAA